VSDYQLGGRNSLWIAEDDWNFTFYQNCLHSPNLY